MDRFTPQTILILSLAFAGVTVCWYFVVAWRTRRILETGTADNFLRYRPTAAGATGGLTSEVLHASLMGSAFSLASAVYVYLNWSAADGAFALWSPITWTLGACVLYSLRGKIFVYSRDSWTLHGFLERSYSSDALKRAASIITSAVFLLQVAAEVYVGLSVLQVFFTAIPLWGLMLATGAIFVGYSVIGGFPAVMVTDAIKYKLIIFGLFIAGIFLMDSGGATAVRRFAESMSSTFLPRSSYSWIILVNLLALNLPIFITDMSVWQRIGAASNKSEVTKGLAHFASMLLPWMAGIIFVGIGFGAHLTPPTGWTVAQSIIAFFSDSLVFPVLLAGLLAALLTTADSYLIAAVQTIVVDWIFAEALRKAAFEPNRLGLEEQQRMLRISRYMIVAAGIGAVACGYLLLGSIPTLLDLLFIIFGMQTALAPSVVYALAGRARPTDAKAGLISIVIGGFITFVCLALAVRGVKVFGVSVGLWAPAFVLFFSTSSFCIFKRSSNILRARGAC